MRMPDGNSAAERLHDEAEQRRMQHDPNNDDCACEDCRKEWIEDTAKTILDKGFEHHRHVGGVRLKEIIGLPEILSDHANNFTLAVLLKHILGAKTNDEYKMAQYLLQNYLLAVAQGDIASDLWDERHP